VIELHGKAALVTGGGSGLGAALCHALAREGVRVAVADINVASADRIASTLNDTLGDGSAIAIELDVADDAAARRAFDTVGTTFGGLDILINNAGTDHTAAIDEIDVERFDRVLATNLRGPFVMTRGALGALRARGGGDVINIASTAARRAWPNASAYHASKWGLVGLSHAMHAELRKDRIRVSAVLAGGMRTPFLLDRFEGIDLETLQEPENVAEAIICVLRMPLETVIPELLVLPRLESSWP
jgi:NAD(P)-dependent dehydrogenase (short-subunit alcohol dehydrogenase family)